MTPINIKLIVFDFDGVLTDNSVLIDESMEYVRCSRSDGLAINAFSKIGMPTLILSTEKNQVVVARAKKFMRAIHDLETSSSLLKNIVPKSISLADVCFVGNDVNDFHVMQNVGLAAVQLTVIGRLLMLQQ